MSELNGYFKNNVENKKKREREKTSGDTAIIIRA